METPRSAYLQHSPRRYHYTSPAFVSTAATAAEIWTTLSLTYAEPSIAHIKQLRQHLRTWTKGTKSINEYYQGFTTRFDQLALLGKPMDLEDQIEHILEGLPEDYKTVADQIEGREAPPSLTEIHEKLLNHEAKLQLVSPPPTSVPVTANFTNYRGNSSNNHNRQNNSRRGGYSGNQNQSQNQPPIQHQTWKQQQLTASAQPNTGRGYQGRCQICSVYGHSARRCPQLQGYSTQQSSVPSSLPWQPRANVAHASLYNTSLWLLDSGATHHLTSDLNNLAIHQPYGEGEQVAIVDGSGLQITHTGSASLSTSSLALKDVLCVPSVKKEFHFSISVVQC